MKTSNKAAGKFFFLAIVLAITNTVNAQPDKSTVKTSVESKQFIFHAQTALPSSGRSRQLTSEYDLRIFSDSLVTEDLILPQESFSTQLLPARREGGISPSKQKMLMTSGNFPSRCRMMAMEHSRHLATTVSLYHSRGTLLQPNRSTALFLYKMSNDI
jgi:hypothetical protein